MGVVILFTTLILVAVFIQYHWKRRRLYKLAYSLPGPPALPIIGNGLKFTCRHEDILAVINKVSADYPKPIRFWFGPVLVLYFSYAQHLEKILSSSKLAYKHDVYDFLKIYLGDGLVSNSGEKHKKHRRLIQPLINLQFVSGNIDKFQKHINVYVKKLSSYCGQPTFDIHDITHECFADLIGESILGAKINVQQGKNIDYFRASAEMYSVAYARFMRPWLHIDPIYNLTSAKNDQTRITAVTYDFIKNKVVDAFHRLQSYKNEALNPTSPIMDQLADIINKDPTVMKDTDFIYHMYTLYIASEDTMTVITSILCVCFGMYPEYQKIAAEEIRSVLGDDVVPIAYNDLSKLQYLDMCIRDVLRLIPIAPIIVRKTIDDFCVDNIVIPGGCGIVVSIFEIHRDPKHWENPNHFHPDHFLPEVVRKRHPFAYVPFSAGPRSCVGKMLALTGLKLIMTNILQRFEIEADGKFPDIVLTSDITVRSLSGYKVRLKKRIWN